MTIKYIIKKLGEVSDSEQCSVDPNYDIGYLAGLISAHSIGAIDIEDHCWFGYKYSYQFAPKSAPALVKVVI
jgi:hypothetical protein